MVVSVYYSAGSNEIWLLHCYKTSMSKHVHDCPWNNVIFYWWPLLCHFICLFILRNSSSLLTLLPFFVSSSFHRTLWTFPLTGDSKTHHLHSPFIMPPQVQSQSPSGTRVLQGDLAALAPAVREFVESSLALCQPDSLHICDGSVEENEALLAQMQEQGMIKKLSKYENWWVITILA